MKKVLITGITGQLGSYLAEKFLNMNYDVHGIIRRSSSFNTGRIDHIFNKLKLHYGDLVDPHSIDTIISKVKPNYLINAAAQSHVHTSFEIPYYTGQVDALGTLSILDSIKKHCPKCRIVQMSTSELFGKVQEIPQNENTPMNCQSPYSAAKLYAYQMTKLYRTAYNLFTCNIICFNMESERRGGTFVTKKITQALSKIVNDKQDVLELGNLDAKRDWGYCPDYADGIIKLIHSDKPDDYVLATNETHSIREFIEESIKVYNKWAKEASQSQAMKYWEPIDLEWRGEGENEVGFCKNRNKVIIKINPKYYRPAEVDLLLGDYSKAKENLGWEPTIKFNELVEKMMMHDLNNIS
jgi:GDPmannose 4,6-dehydratase